jgi:hypothetical protein
MIAREMHQDVETGTHGQTPASKKHGRDWWKKVSLEGCQHALPLALPEYRHMITYEQ